MIHWLKQLDELLRGDRTNTNQLSSGGFRLPLHIFVPAALVMGGIYGFFMGWFALFSGRDGAALHALAVTIKLPALFMFTLMVTFPSLYVFNALVGCRLPFAATLRLLVAAVVVNLAVGASLAPILGFFTLSTTSYPFMVLLNVALLGIAGTIGLRFLLSTLRALAFASIGEHPFPPAPKRSSTLTDGKEDALEEDAATTTSTVAALHAARQSTSAANFIFRIWIIIYAIVGSQMGWILRPFIGSPDSPLSIFRPREGNFFSAVVGAIQRIAGL